MAALTARSPGFSQENSKEKTYPVIRNVVNEKDIENSKKATKEVNLARVLKLLTDKHSKDLIERHYCAVKRLCKCYQRGIYLKDLKVLLEIIWRCHARINIDTRYEELVCMLLTLFREPFLKTKFLDEFTFLQTVSNCLSELGQLAESCSDNIKCVTATSISMLYTTSPRSSTSSADVRVASVDFIKKTTAQSTICKSMTECLAHVSNDDSKYVVLKALNHLSDTNTTCDALLRAGAAVSICIGLHKFVNNYNLVFVGIETLWNILEYGSKEQVEKQLSCIECLRSLKSTFTQKMKCGLSQADRQLRNDIFVLTSLILSSCPSAPLVDSGLAKTIVSYASYPELPTHDDSLRFIGNSKYAEDFELKKHLMNTIAEFCFNPTNEHLLRILSRWQVMLALLSYVKPIKEPVEGLWSLAEFEELQLQAMSVLSVLAPLCVDDYMTYQGNARILSMLDWCTNSDEFGGHGNSFHGTGGRGSKRAHMRYSIRLIRAMCATGNAAVAQDLIDQGIVAQLVGILNSCSCCNDTNDTVDVELQCDMLIILSMLCEGDPHTQELFGECGVKMLLRYLDGYLNVKHGPLHHHRMVLSTADCIWSSVIGCYFNEMTFLEHEGAFFLLDLLEVCPIDMQHVVLGVLVDLTENKKSLRHIRLWSGKNNKSVGKLLVELWKSDELKMGVNRDKDGVITDATRPLKTVQQEEDERSLSIPYSYPSAAVIDVSDNLRSKIYGIFSRLGFNNVCGLRPTDYVAVTVIEKYLDFKTLEIWQEIKEELNTEKIEPISPDKDCMDAIITFIQEKALDISKVQRSLINNDLEDDIIDEFQFYEKIKESHQQYEKQRNNYRHFVDRTSHIQALKEARKEQLVSIERSRLLSQGLPEIQQTMTSHETLEERLNTTSFCGRNVFVESTKFGDFLSPNRLEKLNTSKMVKMDI